MASLQSIAIASIIFLVVLVQQGAAINCYQCTSYNDTRCKDDKILPDEFKKPCMKVKIQGKYENYSICRKIIQTIEFNVNGRAAIKCFECNSHNDSRCALAVPPEELIIDCGEHKQGVQYTFCRKTTQVIEFSVNNLPPDSRVIRGCGWDDTSYKGRCYQRSGFGGRQEVCACYEDNCNAANSISLGFGLIIASFAVIYGLF